MRRRFARGSFRRSGKRSVAWIPGLTTYDVVGGSHSRLISFAQVAAGINTWGFAITLTSDTDLSLHGGEDAVMTRIRGRLYFSDGRVNAGAGLAANGFQMRVVVAQTDTLASTAITPFDHTTSFGLGSDRIMYSGDVLVSSVTTSGVGTGLDGITWEGHYLDIDCRAQRKVRSDEQIVIWFQTVLPGGTTAADLRMRGTLRMLMKRSR